MTWAVALARFVLFCLVALGFAATARGGTRDPSTPDARYLEFGKKFPFVVRLITKHDGIDSSGRKYTEHCCASAVVIKPNWILTAAHVTEDVDTATAIADDNVKHTLAKLIAHKDYDPKRTGWHDIALGWTPQPIQLEFYPELYRKPDELNKACTFAGWGLTGTFYSGGITSDDKRRAGHNKLESELHSVLVCAPSRGAGRFPLEFMLAPGDSGGGMFIGNELAGVNSFLMSKSGAPNGTYNDEAAFTRVSLYVDWVEEQIKQHELALQGRATLNAELP